eukprot:10853855-Lingulodinium_polyedra.AAC.1
MGVPHPRAVRSAQLATCGSRRPLSPLLHWHCGALAPRCPVVPLCIPPWLSACYRPAPLGLRCLLIALCTCLSALGSQHVEVSGLPARLSCNGHGLWARHFR